MNAPSPECERELNRYICLSADLTSEQKHIALLRMLEEIERDSWKFTQLCNAIWMAEVLAQVNGRPVFFVYRSECYLVLRLPGRKRLKIIRPARGRAPPSHDVFSPIPKVELGSCARSDLPTDSA
jgi:hypothetical protein